jgi:hypothetical protein
MRIMSSKGKQLEALIEVNNVKKAELEGLKHEFEVALRRYHICSSRKKQQGDDHE